MKLLVTGSNGFLGKALVNLLESKGHRVACVVRKATATGEVAVGDIDKPIDWEPILQGVDVVIHLAARAHDLSASEDQLHEYRKINQEGTIRLARAAQQVGVKRFIFISSVKAMGEGKPTPYTEADAPKPEDIYGISKWEAEQKLSQLQGSMGIIILRPPLVYGPNVGANFLRLLKMAAMGIPLPLGCIRNQRSMIYVENIADAISCCAEHPGAVGQTYLLSDGKALSVKDLLSILARHMRGRIYFLPVPVVLLRLAGRLLSKQKEIHRLTESLYVDDSKIRTELGWNPPFSTEEGLLRTVAWYKSTRSV